MLRFFITVLGCVTLWIVFVAGVEPQEMIVGAICIPLTVWFVYYAAKNDRLQVRLRFADWIQAWRIPGNLLVDGWVIFQILAKDILRISPAPSLFRSARFACHPSEAVDVARRVLAVTYTSATPNMIVVGIDPETEQMLFHQLQRSDIPKMTRNLGAQP